MECAISPTLLVQQITSLNVNFVRGGNIHHLIQHVQMGVGVIQYNR